MLPIHSSALSILAATILLLAGCEQKNTVSPEDSDALTRPVARFEGPDAPKVEAPKEEAPKASVPSGNLSGEKVYSSKCFACHATGAAGAPKTGDHAAWEPRIATGFDALVQSVIKGKNAMPPKAGATDLTDDEIRRAVAWLANQAGAKFTEPPVTQ